MNRLVIMNFEDPFIHSDDCEFIREEACLGCRFASNFLIRLPLHHFISMQLIPHSQQSLNIF